jgi:hypothetical protein
MFIIEQGQKSEPGLIALSIQSGSVTSISSARVHSEVVGLREGLYFPKMISFIQFSMQLNVKIEPSRQTWDGDCRQKYQAIEHGPDPSQTHWSHPTSRTGTGERTFCADKGDQNHFLQTDYMNLISTKIK